MLSRFIDELTALGGHAIRCSQAELAVRILDLLNEHGIRRIMAWDGACLPGDLLRSLEAVGIEVTAAPDPTIRAGLTGALTATADTGTLVLPGGPGQPLAASLLPEIHIAVLRAGDIKENLAQVFSDESPTLRKVLEASAVALVTGPSRTADIEMTLTIGVHGPGEVHVFCLAED